MEQNILVTGGTGTLGRVLVATLRSSGQHVRVLSRRPGQDTAVADLSANTGLDTALSGISTIIHCATDGRRDVEATHNLIEAAKRAGVTHFVYISIVGVDRHPLFYYRTKLRAERLVERSGIPWTILRATQFHNLVLAVFRAQRFLPVLFAPAFSIQPIAVDDVAKRLVELAQAEPSGRATDIGGPEILSSKELAGMFRARTGSRRPIVPLRLPGKTFAAYAAGYHLTPENRYGTVTLSEFLS
ncbi:SDR family oxidoreductase [Homoserinimonas sp. A520]